MLSLEAKVGAMAIAGLMALALIFFTLNGLQFHQEGYRLKVSFGQVDGLKVGAAVRVAGVGVGKVEDLTLTKEGVVAVLRLGKEILIPQGSRFSIRTTGLMGDKFVEITPNHQVKGYLAAGKTVEGDNPIVLQDMIGQAGTTLAEVKKLMLAFNEIVGKEEVKKSVQDSFVNFAHLTENINQLALLLNQMALDNQGDLRAIVSNLRQMSENIQVASGEVKNLSQGVEANGTTAEKIATILGNLEYSSKRAAQIADDIQSLTGDQELKKDLKVTINEARDTVEKTNEILSRLKETKTSFFYEAQYIGQGKNKGEVENTVSMRLSPNEKQFYLIGLTNREDKNTTNLQLGKRINPSTTFKAGLFKDFMGVALDKSLGDKFSLESQLTNEEKFRFNLKSRYYLKPSLALTIQADNLLGSGEKTTYFGLQQEF